MFSKLLTATVAGLALLQQATSVIIDNGHVRTNYTVETKLATAITAKTAGWKTYGPDDHSLTYIGRWDSKHISWWAAPGLKFGFTGENVAISFGNYTTDGTLLAYRYAGLDWQFTNVTANATHHLISSRPFASATDLKTPTIFEMRVTNYGYGVQVAGIHISPKERIYKYKESDRKIEIIGDSLSAGQYASYGSLSTWSMGVCQGIGNVECAVTAYPGICLADKPCWGNPRGQVFQWRQTQDGNWRQQLYYPDGPEPWQFTKHQDSDIVLINLGTNDNNTANNVSSSEFVSAYKTLITEVHKEYPRADIVLLSLWNGFGQVGETYKQSGGWIDEIYGVYNYFTAAGASYIHYFNTSGILQHNDLSPGTYHPNDLGHLKLANQLIKYIELKFGWNIDNGAGPMLFPYPDQELYNTDCCS